MLPSCQAFGHHIKRSSLVPQVLFFCDICEYCKSLLCSYMTLMTSLCCHFGMISLVKEIHYLQRLPGFVSFSRKTKGFLFQCSSVTFQSNFHHIFYITLHFYVFNAFQASALPSLCTVTLVTGTHVTSQHFQILFTRYTFSSLIQYS